MGKKMEANYQIIFGCIIVAVCAIGAVIGGIMIKDGYSAKNSSSPPEASSVKQQTSGVNSPNINAPNAEAVLINYGIPETIFNNWMKELKDDKEKNRVIEYLLGDQKQKDVTISVMQSQIQDGMEMRKELERRLSERPPDPATDDISPLTQFIEQEFIDNFVSFRAYYHYRKTLKLLNPEMLIELLNTFFRSVLLYPSTDVKTYHILSSDGNILRLQIEGHNSAGEKILISVPELSDTLIRDVCGDFVKSANSVHYNQLLYLFNRALATPELDRMHKTNIFDAQAFIMKNQLLKQPNPASLAESVIVLTEMAGNNKRRPAIRDHYKVDFDGYVGPAQSWPGGQPYPYYGCLVFIKCSVNTLKRLSQDRRHFVVTKIKDIDLIPNREWFLELKSWLRSRGMPSEAVIELLKSLQNLTLRKIVDRLKLFLAEPRKL